MYNPRIISSVVVTLCLLLISLSGRCDDLKKDDNTILATINKYKLTAADFKSEAKDKLSGNLSEADFERSKEKILDEIIMKKLLIQEAQKQNFDKDKAFVKEIEIYWEQALLKLLYNKKSQELLREISRSESDPDVRNQKVREALDRWMEDLKKRADIKKYKENLKAIRPQYERKGAADGR